MQRVRGSHVIAALCAIGLTGAWADNPVEVMARRMSAVATVEKVDADRRQLMLRDRQGHRFTLDVPVDVGDLSKLKPRDQVSIDYLSSIALDLRAVNGTTVETAEVVERVPGPLPGGLTAHEISSTARVVNVDARAHKLTLESPIAGIDTIDISDPAMRRELVHLKRGDRVQATYHRAIAITVVPRHDNATRQARRARR